MRGEAVKGLSAGFSGTDSCPPWLARGMPLGGPANRCRPVSTAVGEGEFLQGNFRSALPHALPATPRGVAALWGLSVL